MSMYDIEIKYHDLFLRLDTAIDSDNGLSHEDMEQLLKELEVNQDEFLSKADAYISRARQKQCKAESLLLEARRLQDWAKSEQRTAEFLIERITKALAARGVKKVETDHFKISLRPSVSVNVIDASAIPEAYQRVTFKREPDKTGIKQAIESGQLVPGAELISKQSLQIR